MIDHPSIKHSINLHVPVKLPKNQFSNSEQQNSKTTKRQKTINSPVKIRNFSKLFRLVYHNTELHNKWHKIIDM